MISLFHEFKSDIMIQLNQETDLTDGQLMELIEQGTFHFARDHPITARQKEQLVKRVFYSIRGLDILQPLIDDPTITEIMINRHDEIYIEVEGVVTRFAGAFESEQKLADIIQSIVAKVNRIVNERTPIVDARLMDGSRVHIVLPPIALKGPTMTIRKFPDQPLNMNDLVHMKSITLEAANMLSQLVQAKYNLFISGGTGSGKTTFLNALTHFIPQEERIITIEDCAELQLLHISNLVSMETRNANTEGKGGISIRDLIRASLRMRPNRIIVGEVRGAEALDMLQAMNSGHEGSISTGHANSAQDMISRLETMVLSGADLPVTVIRNQIASALDIIVHLTRMRDNTRRVSEINEIVGVKNGEVILNKLFHFVETAGSSQQCIVGQLHSTGNQLANKQKLALAGIMI